MIVHRAMRDIERCHEKYGEAWEEYTRRVPWLFIPVSRPFPFPSSGPRANLHSTFFKSNIA